VLIQDQKGQVIAVKVIANRQTRLPATDHDRFDVFAHLGLVTKV
jgi:hypothetical protein